MYEIKDLFSKNKKSKPKTLIAWIPLRCYRVTLCHKLLSQLGKLSHFILLALNEDNVSFEQLCQITNLTDLQLNPLVSRLEGLGLIESKSLSPKGKRLANMLRSLHEQPKTVWLDANHDARNSTPPIMVLETHSELDSYNANDAAIIKSWGGHTKRGWSELDWVIDRNSQRKRLELEKNYLTYLPWLFPEVKEWIESENSSSFLMEWDIKIDIDEEKINKNNGIPIELTFNNNQMLSEDKKRPALSVVSKVLQMELNYSLPEGLPASLIVNIDKTEVLKFCCLENELITETNLLEDDRPSNLEVAETATDEQAVNELLKAVKTGNPLLNRELKFKTLWMPHHFYWNDEILKLKNSSTLFLKRE